MPKWVKILLTIILLLLFVLGFFYKFDYNTYKDEYGSGRTIQIFNYRF